jgi:hypothetical protein
MINYSLELSAWFGNNLFMQKVQYFGPELRVGLPTWIQMPFLDQSLNYEVSKPL